MFQGRKEYYRIRKKTFDGNIDNVIYNNPKGKEQYS